jgi:Na+-driven multidrug efflux pump
MMTFWGFLVSILLFFGGRTLYGIFVPNEPDVIVMGVFYLQILAFIQIPACLEGVAAGIFRGMGKTVPPSVTSISTNILRVVLAYLSVHFTDLGLTGIWLAVALSAGLRGIGILIWYMIHSRGLPKTDEAESGYKNKDLQIEERGKTT